SSLGAKVGEVSLPHTEYALSAYYLIAPSEASSNLARYDGVRYGLRVKDARDSVEMMTKTRGEGFGPEVKRRIMLGTYALSAGYYEAYYGQAQKVRTLVIGDYERAFESFDVLVSPTSATPPVPNGRAIEFIQRIGLALDCRVAEHSVFHRKNYFYPDMPKNFQISQYDLPICIAGHLDVPVEGDVRRIGITRVHMEEDTGKTSHAGATGRIAEADYALIDYNRAGVPLVECVSEPDMRSAEEARAYLTELRATLQALDVSDVRMEEGSVRCDANVSVRLQGSEEL